MLKGGPNQHQLFDIMDISKLPMFYMGGYCQWTITVFRSRKYCNLTPKLLLPPYNVVSSNILQIVFISIFTPFTILVSIHFFSDVYLQVWLLIFPHTFFSFCPCTIVATFLPVYILYSFLTPHRKRRLTYNLHCPFSNMV